MRLMIQKLGCNDPYKAHCLAVLSTAKLFNDFNGLIGGEFTNDEMIYRIVKKYT